MRNEVNAQDNSNNIPNFQAKDFDPNFATLEDFEYLRITETTDIPLPETIISVNGAIIAEAGDMTTISGASKSGKSAISGYIIAASISKDVKDPIPGFNVQNNDKGRAIIHLDTEQSKYSHQRNYIKILRRTEIKDSPDYLLSYNIRKLSLDEYQPTTNGICEAAAKQFGGIHMIIIDGLADYINDVNNETESRNIVKYFMHLAEKYNAAAIVIIHTNPAAKGIEGKERGHLGSECQRKSQSLLTLIAGKDDVSILTAKLFRNAGKEDFEPISLKYDKERGYHVYFEAEREEKNEEKRAELVELAAKIFGDGNAYKEGEILSLIEKKAKLKERAAKDRFTAMKKQGLVIQNDEKKWTKNPYAD